MVERAEFLVQKSERVAEDRFDAMADLDDIVRYAFARLGSRDEAEDVAMEVFQAAFRFRAELPKKRDPKLYLIGIARRKIADHLRARRRQRGPATLSLSDPALRAVTVHPPELSGLMEALERLPDGTRDVLVLKYLLGFSTQEVAGLLGKSPEATNSLLQRARQTLVDAAPHLAPPNPSLRSQP